MSGNHLWSGPRPRHTSHPAVWATAPRSSCSPSAPVPAPLRARLAAGARLHLTGPVLAAIFLGHITRWNDPAITALNPGITLPPAAITVVHRSTAPAQSASPAAAGTAACANGTLQVKLGPGQGYAGGTCTRLIRLPRSDAEIGSLGANVANIFNRVDI